MKWCILYSCLLIGRLDASLIPSATTAAATSPGLQKRIGRQHRNHGINNNNIIQPYLSTIKRTSSFGWSLDRSIYNIRGGATTDSDDEYEVEDSDDEEEDELSEDELSNLEVDSDNEEEEDEEEVKDSPSSSSSGLPVKLTISTNLQSSLLDQQLEFTASRKRTSSLLDQQLEFTASRKRTVLSLKQAVSKTMRGRPPLSSVMLKFSGRLLDDDEIVDDIVAEIEEDDDDDDSDAEDDEDDDDGMVKLKLTCDIVPPIDAKFGIEFREKATQMSTKDLLDAYCVNMAGMMHNSELLQNDLAAREDGDNEVGDDDIDESPVQIQNHALHIRKRAATIQKQMEQSLSANVCELMEQEHERVQAHVKGGDGAINYGGSPASSEGDEIVYGLVPQGATSHRSGRKGKVLKGGATMNIKRSLQRNMNVNWADTTRNSLLFLFFGYFGGRNSFSRTFLLLSSPLCFLIQTRPVKVAMKQLFYTMGEPPGILLSLLPAPQQAIMSLDYGKSMRELYDEKVLQGEEWYEVEKNASEGEESLFFWDDDEEDYDEEYDEESDDEEYY
ncbi:hypothetical protein ACHAWC_006475 [Mediolabrus comicus]